MIDSRFRGFFQRAFLDRLTAILLKLGLRPNQVTIAAIITGLCAGLFLALGFTLLAMLCLSLSGLMDIIDGSLARRLQSSSDFGSALDVTGDRAVELAVVCGLYAYLPREDVWLLLPVLGSFYLCVTTFLLSGIFQKNSSNKSFHYSPGLIERSETFVFFFIVIAWPKLFFITAIIFSALVYLTALIRLLEMSRVLSPRARPRVLKTNLGAVDPATKRL